MPTKNFSCTGFKADIWCCQVLSESVVRWCFLMVLSDSARTNNEAFSDSSRKSEVQGPVGNLKVPTLGT